MNDTTTDLDHADDEILTYTVSDEALEAAGGTDIRGSILIGTTHNGGPYCCG